MNKAKTLLVGLGLVSSGLVYAECAVELPYPQLVDCIVEEGASDRYRPVENEPVQARVIEQDDNDSKQELTFAAEGSKAN